MTHTASSRERHGGSYSVRVVAFRLLTKQQDVKYHHNVFPSPTVKWCFIPCWVVSWIYPDSFCLVDPSIGSDKRMVSRDDFSTFTLHRTFFSFASNIYRVHPWYMQGMNQFPEDVKLTRDTLALLGHVASMEAPGRSFLTAQNFYLHVVAALQRHVTDGVVAVSASSLSETAVSTTEERVTQRFPPPATSSHSRWEPSANNLDIIRQPPPPIGVRPCEPCALWTTLRTDKPFFTDYCPRCFRLADATLRLMSQLTEVTPD